MSNADESPDAATRLVARAAALPLDARLVLVLGSIQRCDPFYRRSIEEYPRRAAFASAVDRALELAWAQHGGGAIDPEERVAVARQLRTFVPDNPGDPILEGDDSWVTMTFGNLADDLDLDGYPDLDTYATATFTVVSNLIYHWYTWAEMGAGREPPPHEARRCTSAYLLELSTQARHIEWLRFRSVDAAVVQRIRDDSIRVGAELLSIVEEWRTGAA